MCTGHLVGKLFPLPFFTGVLFGAVFLLIEMMSSKPMSIESVTPREKLIVICVCVCVGNKCLSHSKIKI